MTAARGCLQSFSIISNCAHPCCLHTVPLILTWSGVQLAGELQLGECDRKRAVLAKHRSNRLFVALCSHCKHSTTSAGESSTTKARHCRQQGSYAELDVLVCTFIANAGSCTVYCLLVAGKTCARIACKRAGSCDIFRLTALATRASGVELVVCKCLSRLPWQTTRFARHATAISGPDWLWLKSWQFIVASGSR